MLQDTCHREKRKRNTMGDAAEMAIRHRLGLRAGKNCLTWQVPSCLTSPAQRSVKHSSAIDEECLRTELRCAGVGREAHAGGAEGQCAEGGPHCGREARSRSCRRRGRGGRGSGAQRENAETCISAFGNGAFCNAGTGGAEGQCAEGGPHCGREARSRSCRRRGRGGRGSGAQRENAETCISAFGNGAFCNAGTEPGGGAAARPSTEPGGGAPDRVAACEWPS